MKLTISNTLIKMNTKDMKITNINHEFYFQILKLNFYKKIKH